MISKKVTTKNTPHGYSILVWVKEGKHVKPLLQIINGYFAVHDNVMGPFT